MINCAELKNFGPIEQLDWQNLGKINLVIGNNGCGKSFLLKALYSAVRTLEDYKRGDNPDNVDDILRSKLYWTFQAEKIADLVANFSRGRELGKLSFSLILNEQKFSYELSEKFTKNFSTLENKVTPRSENSIFLPAKEILSFHHIIDASREINKLFGFDDTYFDLTKALKQIPLPVIQEISWDNSVAVLNNSNYSSIRGRNYFDFNNARIKIRAMIGGEMEFDDAKKRWYFKKGEQRFPMGVTAEGNRKVAVLDNLLGNGYLSESSIIFMDEPESTLHPQYISELLDIIAILANHGIQFFIASHSYFVIKKLFLIAQEQQMSIPVLSYQNNEWVQSDLKDNLPDNPIIDESIKLYEQQLDLSDI
ncbi:MAG: ATP-binding protein [Methylococcales bacterium]|nr:ATP-binding protein [Methylococcales bacterium]